MAISAPTNFAPSIPNVAQSQQAKADQKPAVEADSTPDVATVEQLVTRSDFAAMQLSRLQALTTSLGQSSSSAATKNDPEATAPASRESRMDLYA